MRFIALLLGLLTVTVQAQTLDIGAGTYFQVEESGVEPETTVLQGAGVLLGAAVGGVGGLVLAWGVDSATFTFVSYPIMTAAGAYAAGRLVRADGSFFGALVGGVAGIVPGSIILLVDEGSEDALIDISYTGAIMFLFGAPVGAAVGYHVFPNFLVGPSGELVRGASLQMRF